MTYPDMTQSIELFHRAFTRSKEICGFDTGESAERFNLLIEAAWDLGVIGVESTELKETVSDYFDPSTLQGDGALMLSRTMYERSVSVHRKARQ